MSTAKVLKLIDGRHIHVHSKHDLSLLFLFNVGLLLSVIDRNAGHRSTLFYKAAPAEKRTGRFSLHGFTKRR